MYRRTSNQQTLVVDSSFEVIDGLCSKKAAILLRVERKDGGGYSAVFAAFDGDIPDDLPGIITRVDSDARVPRFEHPGDEKVKIVKVDCAEWKHWKYEPGADVCVTLQGYTGDSNGVFVLQLGHEANRIEKGDFVTRRGILVERVKDMSDFAEPGKPLPQASILYYRRLGKIGIVRKEGSVVYEAKVRFEPPEEYFSANGDIRPLKIHMKRDMGHFGYYLAIEED